MKNCFVRILSALLIFSLAGCQKEQPTETPPETPQQNRNLPGLGLPRGLLRNTPKATPGYIYFSPLLSGTTYLINLNGQVVHTWESDYGPSGWVYLKENGNLARGGRDPETPLFDGGGQGGWLQEFTWDGELVWGYKFSSTEYLTHHDVAIMPNGNYLAIAWEAKTPEEAITAGRNPENIPQAGLWPDWVIELEPRGSNDAVIVWQWHIWDHLVQDYDDSKINYGDVSEHPELLDINLIGVPDPVTEEELNERRAGNNANINDTPQNQGSDMYHTNAINYNARLDQIVLSSPGLDEIMIIDHGTTTEEAGGHRGGRWGKGGDILYRWGNPENYYAGDSTDQKLGGQHDVKWIVTGLPGAGNLMVFNNNVPYAEPGYSSVLELKTPLTDSGYLLGESGQFGPEEPKWSYVALDTLSFYSPFISGSHRMANGNTFITEGARGRFFEVNAKREVLWEYMTPYAGYIRMADGTTPQPIGPFEYGTFRATHIPVDHPAVASKILEPLDPQPEVYKLKKIN